MNLFSFWQLHAIFWNTTTEAPIIFVIKIFFHVGVSSRSLVGNLIWHSLHNEVLMNLKEAQKMPQGKEICWGDTKMSHKMMYQWGSTNRKQCLKIKHTLLENHPKIVSFFVILHFNNLFLCFKRYLFSIKWDFLAKNQTPWFWLKNHFLIVGNQTKMPHIWPLLWNHLFSVLVFWYYLD